MGGKWFWDFFCSEIFFQRFFWKSRFFFEIWKFWIWTFWNLKSEIFENFQDFSRFSRFQDFLCLFKIFSYFQDFFIFRRFFSLHLWWMHALQYTLFFFFFSLYACLSRVTLKTYYKVFFFARSAQIIDYGHAEQKILHARLFSMAFLWIYWYLRKPFFYGFW